MPAGRARAGSHTRRALSAALQPRHWGPFQTPPPSLQALSWPPVTTPSWSRMDLLPVAGSRAEPPALLPPTQRWRTLSPLVHAAVLGLRVACFLVSQTNMPFLSIYLLALEQDMEHGTSVLQAANTLQQQTFLQVRGRKAISEGSSPAAGQRGRLVVASLVLLPRAALPETGIQLPLGSTTARARHPRALLWPQRLNEPKLPARCWVLRGVRYKVWEEKTHSLANPRAPPYPSPPRPRSPCTPPLPRQPAPALRSRLPGGTPRPTAAEGGSGSAQPGGKPRLALPRLQIFVRHTKPSL